MVDSLQVGRKLKQVLKDLFSAANLRQGSILVIGCSTSEVAGKKIGTASNVELAETIWTTIHDLVREKNIYPAVQCCEHLNRAIVLEREAMENYALEEVTVVPAPKAGGALAAAAFNHLKSPVVVETIQAHAGIDIGDTFIGMHLKPVAVPVRSTIKQIGNAHLTMARTRPKLIGGERALYKKEQPEIPSGKTC